MSLLTTPSSSSVPNNNNNNAASSSSSSSVPSSSSSSTNTSSNSGGGGGGGGNNNGVPNAAGSVANNNLPFEKDKIWYFSNEQLANSPSRRYGIKPDDELHYRQMTAYLIQEMGQRLQVSQLCINTAIVYMHRFYAFHSFTHFHRNSMASASLFLAAKVEEQPRKLEHVIRAANKCLPQTTEQQNYADLAQELVFNENVLLQTLGFDVAIDHPHTHVVRTCQLVKACKDLAQTSYFLASNSLHLTSMCLQYRPTVVACFCIYLACKWSRWEIPQSTEGKHWFYYVDKSVSLDLLKKLTDEFIAIYEKSPARLKSKLNSIKAIAQGASNRTAAGGGKDNKPKEDWKMSEMMKGYHSNITAPPELMNGNEGREQTPQQAAALLPPPAILPQQRRSDHGSHQRSSVSGGSSQQLPSSHKLPNYPGSMPPDAHSDHKSKQLGYNNRAPGSHQSSSSVQRSSSSGSGSSGSGQRSSSSGQQQPRPPMPPMDYHKSSRGMPGVGLAAHSAHKMPPNAKQPASLLDGRSSSSSSSSSSAVGGLSSKDVVAKSGSSAGGGSSSSKLYPNVPPPPYGNSVGGAPPPGSLMHGSVQSRGGYGGSGSSGSSNNGMPPSSSSSSSAYHAHRSKSSSSSSSSSVHNMPPYEQLTSASLPYGQSASSQHQGSHLSGYNSHLQAMQVDSVPGSGAQPQSGQQQQQQQQQMTKSNSLFSPEWSEAKKDVHFNGLLPPPPSSHDSLSYKLNSHGRDKDSPKKDRLHATGGTPTKKDKHRLPGPGSLPPTSSSSSSALSASAVNSQHGGLKAMLPPSKKLPSDLLAGPSDRDGSGGGNLKRPNELSGSQYGLNKLDEELLPREKLRKMESGSGLPGYGYGAGSSSSLADHDKHTPLSMSNGIETTPDLVRSLLKESLCTSNASLLKPDPLTMPGLKPPAELLEPMPTTLSIKKEIGSEPMATGLGESLLHASGLESLDPFTKLGAEIKEEPGSSSKAEKKKKKEKHKHKEKDKSKDKGDKEERKKHKKDKQKERSKDLSGNSDSLKLVIKTSSVGGNPNGMVSVHPSEAPPGAMAAPLKLKISKNKVEPNNYSMAHTTSAATAGPPGYGLSQASSAGAAALPATSMASASLSAMPGMPPAYSSGVGAYGLPNLNVSGGSNSSSSSSGKKKDRDRERDKDSKRSKSQEYAKYNGAGGGGGMYAPPSLQGGPNQGGVGGVQQQPGMLINPHTLPPPNTALPVYTKK